MHARIPIVVLWFYRQYTEKLGVLKYKPSLSKYSLSFVHQHWVRVKGFFSTGSSRYNILRGECTTGNAASTESSVLCREPDPKLSAQGRFAESKGSSSRHRKNPRYRRTMPRGNIAGSRHRHRLTAHSICAESCISGPSAQPPPHGAT
jgi:hypothetical protein